VCATVVPLVSSVVKTVIRRPGHDSVIGCRSPDRSTQQRPTGIRVQSTAIWDPALLEDYTGCRGKNFKSSIVKDRFLLSKHLTPDLAGESPFSRHDSIDDKAGDNGSMFDVD
jgi:hypothetical protein